MKLDALHVQTNKCGLAHTNEVLREISIEENYVGEWEILSTVIKKL